MRIAQIATCSGPVREDRTGSVEALVWLITRELVALGHEVTVFACAGSEVHGELVVTQPGPYGINGAPSDWQLCDWTTIAEAVAQSERFDILHSHAYLWALPVERFSRAPMLHTMHTMPYHDEAAVWSRFPAARITALSHAQWRAASPRVPYAVIPSGVDPAHFTFRDSPGHYLCYLGRFTPSKGAVDAITASHITGIPLVLAGPENEFFRREIRPRIDGVQIRWIGPVDRHQRNELLGNALALLYPLHQPEPFGLVQVEAMMCGTPVIATDIGAIPEIVVHGASGIICHSPADLATAIPAAASLSRAHIRAHAEQFTVKRMASSYSATYADITGGTSR
jgi:glycosyltransferase involved in cell wall biosynthesis